jgi:hypothetical protein
MTMTTAQIRRDLGILWAIKWNLLWKSLTVGCAIAFLISVIFEQLGWLSITLLI